MKNITRLVLKAFLSGAFLFNTLIANAASESLKNGTLTIQDSLSAYGDTIVGYWMAICLGLATVFFLAVTIIKGYSAIAEFSDKHDWAVFRNKGLGFVLFFALTGFTSYLTVKEASAPQDASSSSLTSLSHGG